MSTRWKKSHSYLYLVVAALTCSLANANPPEGETPTFRRLVTIEQVNGFQISLPLGCVPQLREFFANGGSLKSDFVSSHLVKVKETAFKSGVSDSIFYRYSDRQRDLDLVSIGEFKKIFSYSRSRTTTDLLDLEGNPFQFNLYLAEDPQSSASFGRHQLVLKINPEAKIFSVWFFSSENPLSALINFTNQILSSSGLTKCVSSDSRVISQLIMEESGVQLFDYYIFERMQWFVVIDPEVVQNISVSHLQ
jgi:hypothetical protein